MHSHKLLHLDIKPGNIYVRNDGSPLLIDFGAARQTLTAEGTKLPPMYTPGFASPEHYANRENLGPWSDMYSVGSAMYACLSAEAPQPADRRLVQDDIEPARKAWSGKYTSKLLDTIDWCMRLDHMERPQSVLALQKALLGQTDPGYKGEGPLIDQIKGLLSRFTRRPDGDAPKVRTGSEPSESETQESETPAK